jgi:hypothetical protein
VTATLRLTLDRRARLIWTPRLEGPGGDVGTASGLRLIDEVNARDHAPLRDADDRCLCSSGIDTLETAGETMVVSAKFPAPPPDVAYASLQAPGFPSLDRIPLAS